MFLFLNRINRIYQSIACLKNRLCKYRLDGRATDDVVGDDD